MKIITSNLLAEKPYLKYAGIGGAHTIDFDARAIKFNTLINSILPDIMLFQEVDLKWKTIINNEILPLGYDFYFGTSWSSGLAIGIKSAFEYANVEQIFNHTDSGLLLINLRNKALDKKIQIANIHAPWGKADRFNDVYYSCFGHGHPIVVGGDLNTDLPENNSGASNTNQDYFIKQLFEQKEGWNEISKEVQITARNVKNNKPEKLDFLFGKKTSAIMSKTFPEDYSNLIPHYKTLDFDFQCLNNHYSDHSLIISELRFIEN